MKRCTAGIILLMCNVLLISGDLSTNPFLAGVFNNSQPKQNNDSSGTPRPTITQPETPTTTTVIDSTQHFVAGTLNLQEQPQLPTDNIQPIQQQPSNVVSQQPSGNQQQPADSLNLSQQASVADISPVIYQTAGIITPSSGNLDKYCLKPRGQFPSQFCNTFVNCWDGLATEQSCGNDLVFNPKGYCDYPGNVPCAGKSNQGALPTTTVPGVVISQWTLPPSSSVQSSSITVPLSPSVISLPSDDRLRGLCVQPRGQFPSSSCNKYVNCWDGNAVEQECPPGLLFSSKGYCDYPNRVACGERSTVQATSNSVECLLEYGTFRDRINCSTYYTCIAGQIKARHFCPEGFHFNDNIGVCDYAFRVDCSKEPLAFQTKTAGPLVQATDVVGINDNSECPSEFGIFRHSTNCSLYFTCVSNKVITRYECPQGFFFNDDIGVCDYPDRVDCNRPPKAYNSNLNIFSQIPAELIPQINNCAPGAVFSLNAQCTSACICREGVAEIVQCPAGLAYDSKSDKCLLPHIARC